MKRLNSLTKSKKLMGTLVATLLLVGSLGATALAVQGTDTVKKGVLMTESQAPTHSAQAGDSKAAKNNPGTITEDQAKEIAETTLKAAFGSSFNAGLKQYSNHDQSTWVLYWSSKDFTSSSKTNNDELTPNGPITLYGARLDAKTGEVLNIVNKSFNLNQKPQTLSEEKAKELVLQFIESSNLNKGASVTPVLASNDPYSASFTIELANKQTIRVVISKYSNSVVGWSKE